MFVVKYGEQKNHVANEIGDGKVKFSRDWCFPNSDTLSMDFAKMLVLSYIKPDMITVDPFSKDCMIAEWRNDLNPDTKAEYHLEAHEFLLMCKEKTKADLVIFDPPYSLRQVKECYSGFGRKITLQESQSLTGWTKEKNVINQLLKLGGYVISFGWNSAGMGITRMYDIVEIKLLCHGAPHNDTIIVVEQKIAHQERLEI